MTTLREAAQQALEALVQIRTPLRINTALDAYDVSRATAALRTALAEPEQKPVGQLQEEVFGRGQVMWFRKPQNNAMLYTHPVDDTSLLRQALEVLENTSPMGFNMERDKQFFAAITALRDRLKERT
jgi:hypothetical protein